MIAFQCSRCKRLNDLDEKCDCQAGIDPRPNRREKGDAELCRKSFEPLEPKKQWHQRFYWER
jgi:hypothetical protein